MGGIASLIALAGPQKIVRLFSAQTGEQVSEIKKHTDWVYAVEFSPDGVLLATADRSGGMFVWEADTAREYQNLAGHKGAVTDVTWRIDSNILASASVQVSDPEVKDMFIQTNDQVSLNDQQIPV